jgi:hypothetical protein
MTSDLDTNNLATTSVAVPSSVVLLSQASPGSASRSLHAIGFLRGTGEFTFTCLNISRFYSHLLQTSAICRRVGEPGVMPQFFF